MHTDTIFLIGAGGHAKVVLDALLLNEFANRRICVSDNNPALQGKTLLGLTIAVPALPTGPHAGMFHVAIGNGRVREKLHDQLTAAGCRPLTVVHAAALLSRFSSIGSGSFVAARAIVAPAATIGDGVIVNHGAVVDHDCQVGAYSHIAPNATLAGGVRIGARVLIGAGANVLPGVHIGDDAVVGAGAVVLKDIAAGETYAGVPATRTSRRKCD